MSDNNNEPLRGFPAAEFAARCERLQRKMTTAGIAATVLTTEADIRYFSGFDTPFWQSPTRPWFLIVPVKGESVAVIPTIGVIRMRHAYVGDIRPWESPRPQDEGVSEVVAVLQEITGGNGVIAVPLGAETQVRAPLSDIQKVATALRGATFTDATPMLRELRAVKSEREIKKMRRACRAAADGFAAAAAQFTTGMRDDEVFRLLKIECLRHGADDAPYVAGGADANGCADIIAPPVRRSLRDGDILNLDLGCVYDGYYSDFNRNFAIKTVTAAQMRAYDSLFHAVSAGLTTARPGASCADVFNAMAAALENNGAKTSAAGRMGHGVGLQLTEPPSIMPDNDTTLTPGMVLALEPSALFSSGIMMTHEENIVVREGEPELLSRRAPPILPLIE